MPYKVEPNGDKFDVVNTETSEVKATHDSKDEADRQVRLLTELENHKGWEE
jgi:hypothetical protein